MQFSRCLSKILRHTAGKGHHSRRQAFERITDKAGWARIPDIVKTAKSLTGNNWVPPLTIIVNYMLGVVCDDDKARFQMAVLVGVPDVPDPSTKLHVYMVYGMRA
eukprot:4336049-Heterocapsa_arctica.AAC.1